MLENFILFRLVPPIFKFFEFQVVSLYRLMKKYIPNPKQIVRYTIKFCIIFSDSPVKKVMYISENIRELMRMM